MMVSHRRDLPWSYRDVPDQVGTLSQVGTKKISKGGWTILELLRHIRTITDVFVLKVIKRGLVGTDSAHLNFSGPSQVGKLSPSLSQQECFGLERIGILIGLLLIDGIHGVFFTS